MAKKTNDQAAGKGPDAETFEDCLRKLEAIVEAMEEGQLPLEELVKQYDTGSALLARCDSFLRSARERVELITLKAQSELEREDEPTGPAEDTEDDEIRLF